MGTEPKKDESKSVKVTPNETKTEKVSFLSWFSKLVDTNSNVKAHHLKSIEAYFRDLGYCDDETEERFNEGLKKFGF